MSTAAVTSQNTRFLGERWYTNNRLKGLSRFAFAITLLNVLGHLWLGFEQSWLTPFVALAAAYGTDLLAETVDARFNGRKSAFSGGFGNLVAFLLPAHISGLAVGMLLFGAEQLWIIAFGAAVSIASKWVFRIAIETPSGRLSRPHFFNPSNFGITVVLLLFPSVGIAPPYMFAENISGALDWILPLIIVCTGSLLNTKLTGRMPLILAWLVAFAAQAAIRSAVNGTPLEAALLPMTGFAFVLFTFYMITDPGATPFRPRSQIMFAVAVAALYGLLVQAHIVFAMFYALSLVSAGRGLLLLLSQIKRAQSQARRPLEVSA